MKVGRSVAAIVAALWIVMAAGFAAASDSGNKTSPTTETPAPPVDSTAAPANTPHELTAADLEAWLDSLLTYGLKNGDIAGGVISVVKDGKVLFQSGYGYADVEKKIPMDAERVMMRIGSTSKLFTWTAVMQLVEQGKLDLQRNVDDYLDFKVSPPGAKPITLLDLMHHRGGFEEGLKDLLSMDPNTFQSTETYLKQHPRPLLFDPGTVPPYSNYGTALAGYIVQRVSGEPFERYVEKHIFSPLGMKSSTFDQPLPARFDGMLSRGYRTASTAAQPVELVTTGPAGAVATTAADMARFMLAHLQQGHLGNADILSAKTAELMHTPSETALPGFATMAHGFFYETHNDRILIGHGGDTIFFHTELELLPREGVGIFYSFNSRGKDNAVYGLRKALLDQFLDRYFPPNSAAPERATLASAVTDSRKIAGHYESSRRVQHGFLSIFYLLQQTAIDANPDGTVVAPGSFEPGDVHYHEVAPEIWREIGGTHQIAFRNVAGVDTVLDSEDPTSVLQRTPFRRTAALNLTVSLASCVTLALALILWPVGYLVRRHYQRPLADSAEVRRLRTFLRIAATVDVLWLVAWTIALLPLLSTELDVYKTALDPVIRMLQIAGLLVVAGAAVGLWSLWRLCRLPTSWLSRIGNGLIVVALLGLVWIGCIGDLISFNLNY